MHYPTRWKSSGAILLLAALLATNLRAAGPGGEMSDAAGNFLKALSAEQKAKATYVFEDAQRFDWHFIPKPRKGLPFKEMTPAQQKLAHALLASGMSQRGYAKATTIMSLEQVLAEIEAGKGQFQRDPELYFFTVFGDPTGSAPWGWRVEGHHVSLNFVVQGDHVLAANPAFFGTNPAEIRSGPRQGLSVLAAEQNLGRHLVNSLTDEQKKIAIITNEAPKDIITFNARNAKALEPLGLANSALTQAQHELLVTLVKEYAYRHRAEIAEQDLAKIQHAGWDKVYFAWAGGTAPGDLNYYRVQGPGFLLEFDNTQNNGNHVHSVWRDFANDFGDDVLRRHYEEVPHGK